MQLTRYKNNPILFPDSSFPWQAKGVCNPCVLHEQDTFHMLYRGIGNRTFRLASGWDFPVSAIGYATSTNGYDFAKNSTPLIFPEYEWEALGCEDPRWTKLNNTYYIFYTAISLTATNTLSIKIALATTDDFIHITKQGLIELPENAKAGCLFPEKIQNKYVFLYTQDADTPQSIIRYACLDTIDDLIDKKKWQSIHKLPLVSPSLHSIRGAETGAPPIKVGSNWLCIFCPEATKHEWDIAAMVLNQDLSAVIKTFPSLLVPEMPYEISGIVENVVFPTGALVNHEELFVYYGAADSSCCLATMPIDQLLP